MPRLRWRTLVPVVALAGAVGCASANGARPRPFPTPGARPTPGVSAPAVPVGEPSTPDAAVTGDLASTIVSLALSLTGTPYRNGGADPSGFDCSGFVQYVFSRAGVGVPRTVAAQFDSAAPVETYWAADLLFFTTTAPGPTHVAIALGDGRFVHAPSSRGVVRVERLDARYWRDRFVAVRRVLPDAPLPPATNR